MKVRLVLLAAGVVVLCASLATAGVMPGVGMSNNAAAIIRQLSSCVGDFGGGTGICNIFEEPDNPEQQDFNLGSPSVGTGLVDIYDSNGVTLSDSLDFYLNADGNVHLLFQSEGFAQSGGFFGGVEAADGSWCYLCGEGNNVYQGVSPEATPEPSSLLILCSGMLGIAGMVRRRSR